MRHVSSVPFLIFVTNVDEILCNFFIGAISTFGWGAVWDGQIRASQGLSIALGVEVPHPQNTVAVVGNLKYRSVYVDFVFLSEIGWSDTATAFTTTSATDQKQPYRLTRTLTRAGKESIIFCIIFCIV
jgi:hypothetical protein